MYERAALDGLVQREGAQLRVSQSGLVYFAIRASGRDCLQRLKPTCPSARLWVRMLVLDPLRQRVRVRLHRERDFGWSEVRSLKYGLAAGFNCLEMSRSFEYVRL